MTSKQLRGKAATCKLCGDKTYWYVAILKGNHESSMQKCWFICLHCYEEEPWSIETKIKELTMKNGSLNGSSQSALSASESPLAERSVENGAETFTSHWTDSDGW